MEHKEVFSRNLQRYMALNGKSRKEVCEALGYSYFTFSDWINGKKMPRMDKVEQLANYFGIKKSDLIEETKKEQPTEYDGLSKNRKALIDFAMSISEEKAEKFLRLLQSIEEVDL